MRRDRRVPRVLRWSRTPGLSSRTAPSPARPSAGSRPRPPTPRAPGSCFTSSCRAMNSELPPSRMSVPRPAMLVAIVTMPSRPACATISASFSWNFAFSTTWRTPLRFRISREQLRLLNRRRAHQHRLLLLVQTRNLIGHGKVLLLRRAVHHVRVLHAQHLPVGRNHHNIQLVNLVELRRFRLRRSGHAAKASCTCGSSSGR